MFEDLSKIIQKVMATRLEFISFDKSKSAGGKTGPGAAPQLELRDCWCNAVHVNPVGTDGRGRVEAAPPAQTDCTEP